ncbi:MAG: S8 family serine peptidase, partial [Acidimicrobiales bacterium]
MRGTKARLSAVLIVGGAVLSAAQVAPSPAGAQARAAYQNLQWGLSAIGAPAAWQYGTGSGVRIGIVDTGIDFAQQDLQGKVVASTVFQSSTSAGCPQPTSAQDDNGHGTHVAGIAAATGAHGVSGVAPGASLVVAKVLDCK